MQHYRLGRSHRDCPAGSDVLGNSRTLRIGQLVYCVKWEGALPRMLEGQIVGMDDRSLIVRGTDGMFLDELLTLPVKSVFRQALEAIGAEMQWLRWFLPHDRVGGGDAAARRTQQIAGLEQLQMSMEQRGGRGRSRRRNAAA